MRLAWIALVVALLASTSTLASDSVHFIEPKDGATVKQTFKIKFGLKGEMTIRPAGDLTPKTGHHHLIIDGSPTPQGQPVPSDEKHIHFGKGQTETEVTLKPGKYRLTMQFADGVHRSYGEPLSSTITVQVK